MRISVSMTRREKLLGYLYLIFELFFLPSLLLLLQDSLSCPLTEGQSNTLYFLINFLSVLLISHRFLWKNLRIAVSKPFRTLRYGFWGFVLYYGFNMLITMAIQRFYPDFFNVNDTSVAEMVGQFPIGMTIGTVFLVPVVEEVLFRGVVFRGIYDRNRFLAYGISTVVFCAIHILAYIGIYDTLTLALCFVQYLPAGIFLAWAYERSDTICCPILIHMTVNQIGMYIMR